jgi:hypothetical protein
MVISPEGVRDGIIKTGTQASKKTAESIISQGDAVKAATEKIAETVIEEGSSKAEGLGVFLGNLTKSIQDSTKGGVMVHSGKRAASSGFKASTDFSRGDPICGTLCTVSSCCEVVSGVIVWIPFPGKICTVASLKAVSVGCEKIRDMCAANPAAPGC